MSTSEGLSAKFVSSDEPARRSQDGRSAVRVAVVCGLPIQYMSPLFAALSDVPSIDLTVLYSSSMGTEASTSPFLNFGHQVVWDVDVLRGYRSKVLWNPVEPNVDRRWTMVSPLIARELHRSRCDVAVIFGWRYPVNWLSYVFCRARGVPYLMFCDTDVRDPGETRLRLVRHLVLRSLCSHAAGALYVGTFNRDFYIRHGMPPERLWFAPFSVDIERFSSGDRDTARSRLGLMPGRVYLLFVGALSERKRPLLLFSALETLQRRGANVGLLVAGTGELEADMRHRIASSGLRDVHLRGFVNQVELPDLYAAADIFVLPSRRDAHGMVVNEAMAAGLPVIISTGTGLWGPGDLVAHGSEGLVFEADNLEALTSACEALLDPATRERMGSNARRRIGELSYQTALRGWVEAVEAVAGRRPVAPSVASG
jgi:glycosyltransferase involved in cell wall biosynthesis